MKLNNLTQENILIYWLKFYLLFTKSAYVNTNVVYIKTNYRNGLIFFLTYMKVKNNKMFVTKFNYKDYYCYFDI